jgi:hypothetical protein
VLIQAFSMHLLFTASISTFTIASSLTPTYSEDAITIPARMYNVEEAKVTTAPQLMEVEDLAKVGPYSYTRLGPWTLKSLLRRTSTGSVR